MPNMCGSSSQLGKIQINYQIIYYKYDRKQKRKFNLCCFLFKDIIRVAAHFLLIHNCKVSFLVYLLQKWYRLWRLVQVTYCVVLICSVELGCIFTLLVRRERPDPGSNWEMKKILKKKIILFLLLFASALRSHILCCSPTELSMLELQFQIQTPLASTWTAASPWALSDPTYYGFKVVLKFMVYCSIPQNFTP